VVIFLHWSFRGERLAVMSYCPSISEKLTPQHRAGLLVNNKAVGSEKRLHSADPVKEQPRVLIDRLGDVRPVVDP